MSAQVIQFGKAQPATAEPVWRQRVNPTRSARPRSEAVRFMLDGELYEVVFYGDAVERVHSRSNTGSVPAALRR
jgi:hypothetical protein